MWHYSQNGQTFGPISDTELESRVQSGALPSDVYVWRDGMGEWQPYNAVRTAAVAAPPVLRVNLPATAGAEAAAETETVSYEAPQGGTRFESFSSWGTVAMLVIGMFVFLGVLANRPSMAGTRDFEDMDDDAETVEQSTASNLDAEAAGGSAGEPNVPPAPLGGVQMLNANVKLRLGTLSIQNQSSFDWPATSISFSHGGKKYSYDLENLDRSKSTSVRLASFETADGTRYKKGFSKEPTSFVLNIKGYGMATARLSKRP